MYVLPPITTEGLTSADAGALMEQTFSVMKDMFDATAMASKEELETDLREDLTQ